MVGWGHIVNGFGMRRCRAGLTFGDWLTWKILCLWSREAFTEIQKLPKFCFVDLIPWEGVAPYWRIISIVPPLWSSSWPFKNLIKTICIGMALSYHCLFESQCRIHKRWRLASIFGTSDVALFSFVVPSVRWSITAHMHLKLLRECSILGYNKSQLFS